MSNKKNKLDKPINFVHKHMVEFNKSVAFKSQKDYDRQRDKQQLKREPYD